MLDKIFKGQTRLSSSYCSDQISVIINERQGFFFFNPLASKTFKEKSVKPEAFFKPLAQNQTNSKQFYKRTTSYFLKSFELYTKWQLQGNSCNENIQSARMNDVLWNNCTELCLSVVRHYNSNQILTARWFHTSNTSWFSPLMKPTLELFGQRTLAQNLAVWNTIVFKTPQGQYIF